MREKLLTNDIHLGVLRTGGTTIASAVELRKHLQHQLGLTLGRHMDKDVIINGDLFDAFNVPLSDVLEFFGTATEWLNATKAKDFTSDAPQLVLGRGNHDVAKDSSKLSSFDFIGAVLKEAFPDRVQIVTEPTMIFPGIYMIPHATNQDIFELQLAEAAKLENSLILVHANFDNMFAVESDHSLNITREQAKVLTAQGNTLVFGHEHQAKVDLAGKLIVTGNQWPSSIADCLGNPDGLKHAHVISREAGEWDLTQVCTWDASEYYQEVPWDEMLAMGVDQDPNFVRVCGYASVEQASEVVAAVAKYRQRSSAFVVSNDVKIAGVTDMADLPASLQDVKSFDVMSFLLENLENDEQRKVVTDLVANAELREAA